MKRSSAKFFLFIATIWALSSYCVSIQAQQVIAHRGFWNTAGSAQNSITSLIKADSIKVYGSEFDVWLTSDSAVVVNHDGKVTIDGNDVLIQDTPLEQLRTIKLENGEILPTFAEYLDAFEACKNTKLIIECKPHKTDNQEYELAKRVTEMVNEHQLQDKVEYISFSLNLCTQLRDLSPNAKIYYLNGDLSPEELSSFKLNGPDYDFKVILNHPEWIESAHTLGQQVNVWTVNSPEDIQKMINLKVDFITTDEPLIVEDMLKSKFSITHVLRPLNCMMNIFSPNQL